MTVSETSTANGSKGFALNNFSTCSLIVLKEPYQTEIPPSISPQSGIRLPTSRPSSLSDLESMAFSGMGILGEKGWPSQTSC